MISAHTQRAPRPTKFAVTNEGDQAQLCRGGWYPAYDRWLFTGERPQAIEKQRRRARVRWGLHLRARHPIEVFGLPRMGPDWYRLVVCADRPGQPVSANGGVIEKGGFPRRGISDSRFWLGLGASIGWQDPIHRICGIGLSGRWRLDGRAERRHRCLA